MIKTVEQIFEDNISLNQHITKEDVLKCIHDALDVRSEHIIAAIKPLLSDDLLNAIRNEHGETLKKENLEEIDVDDYLTGFNDGIYALRNWMLQEGS